MNFERHFKTIIYVDQYDSGVCHEFRENKSMDRKPICRSNYVDNNNNSFYFTSKTCIVYNVVGWKRLVWKTKWATISPSKRFLTSEDGDAVYLVRWEGCYVIRAPFVKSGVEFRKAVLPTRPIKGRPAIHEKRPELANF